MKRSFFSLVVLLNIVGCVGKKELPYAVISGKVAKPSKESLKIVSDRMLLKEIHPKADGTFRDTIKDINGKYYYYLISNQESIPLYLERGTDVVLEIPEKIKDFKVTGKGAENVKYLVEKSNYLSEKIKSKDSVLFGKKPEDFKAASVDILEQLRSKLVEKHLDKKFTAYEQKFIDYYFIQLLEDYPKYNALITGVVPEIPAGYNPGKKNINLDQADLYANVSTFQTIVRNHLYNFFPTYNDTEQIQKFIDEALKFKAQNIRLEIAKVLASFLKIDGENNDRIYKFINENITDEAFREEVKTTYQNSKKLTKGTPAPSFAYENYKGGKTSLEDLRGKVVYIDVWATWCMPCIQQLPHLQELEKKFHGKPVAFVSVSIDEPKEYNRWKQFIEKRDLKGIQLVADKGWKSQIVQDFIIGGIPRFILIDKEGKIVKADAPRPSEPAIVDLIESLL